MCEKLSNSLLFGIKLGFFTEEIEKRWSPWLVLDDLIYDYKYLGLFSITCSDGRLVTLLEEVEVLEWSEEPLTSAGRRTTPFSPV